ncbi:MAG: AbrB/MazE/SpoVT family DNA-binding domain-containing protein [Candidatus Peregrinibacteria bacterium]
MTYTLKLFNTGQITLPKAWREQFDTKNFLAKETEEGLLIKPLEEGETVYYEEKDGFGLYCEKGLPVDEIISKIRKIHGSH